MKHVAASDCEAVHGRDHRLRHVPDQAVEVGDLEQTVRSRPVVAGLTPLLDVAADAECAVALAGEDDGANIDVRPRSLERVNQLLDGPGAKGVEPVGAVDGDDGHRTIDLVEQVFVVHLGASSIPLDHGRDQLARSSKVPVPSPPPQHMVTSA